MALLSEAEIIQKMMIVKTWKRKGNSLSLDHRLKDFVCAMGFVQSVAILAEKADHHPDITIRWNAVTLELTSHSEGGLTEKDFLLATQINSLIVSTV